jgi:hypothetical protein
MSLTLFFQIMVLILWADFLFSGTMSSIQRRKASSEKAGNKASDDKGAKDGK